MKNKGIPNRELAQSKAERCGRTRHRPGSAGDLGGSGVPMKMWDTNHGRSQRALWVKSGNRLLAARGQLK